MSESDHYSSKRAAILEQLSYLIDELEAQRPWITRIPAFQLTGKPFDTAPSLLEMYQDMCRKEWNEFLPALGVLDLVQEAEPADISDIVDRIQTGRRALVNKLVALPHDEWTNLVGNSTIDVSEYSFQITQSDSTFLRSIAERLHESMITFSR